MEFVGLATAALTGLALLASGPPGSVGLAEAGERPAHAVSAQLTQDDVRALLASGERVDLDRVRRLGMLVFTTPFNALDGHGDGPFDPDEGDPTALGQRPTLQGNGQFLRVNGLDAQACNECHSVVSNATRPPRLGIGGVGTVAQNAIVAPSMIDVADSGDDRVQYAGGHQPDMPLFLDGEADFNGRFINPPFLFGGGGVELLGKEMTEDLQQLLVEGRSSPAGTVIELETHGVHFGDLTSLGGGEVSLDPEGIGPVDYESVPPEEVLVVRPFGRKGESFSMRDFDRGATQFHLGIQPVEVVGEGTDPDGDGVTDEITVAEMSALHVFDVTNPPPVRRSHSEEARHGRQLFADLGCASCHVPSLRTREPFLLLAHPEVASDPSENVYAHIDLRKIGFKGRGRGVRVPLFADLKRHQMGERLAEDCELCSGIANDEFTTARLWGVADTAPYLHDGRATTLFLAIEFHGGEAQEARDNFLALGEGGQSDLIAFLRTLRTPRGPNVELVQ